VKNINQLTADLTKRFGKLYRLVSHIQLLTIAGRTSATKHWRHGWNRRSNAEHIDPDLLRQLALELAHKQYHSQAVRRTYIPKGKRDGVDLAFRLFGTRIVQAAVAQILEAITNPCFVIAL